MLSMKCRKKIMSCEDEREGTEQRKIKDDTQKRERQIEREREKDRAAK